MNIRWTCKIDGVPEPQLDMAVRVAPESDYPRGDVIRAIVAELEHLVMTDMPLVLHEVAGGRWSE